jgi:hypothetical protein
MAVDVDAGSFGNVLFSVLAGWRRVALRVFIAVMSCSLWRVCFLLEVLISTGIQNSFYL